MYNYLQNLRKNNYSSLDVKIITENRRFWKTVKPNSRRVIEILKKKKLLDQSEYLGSVIPELQNRVTKPSYVL